MCSSASLAAVGDNMGQMAQLYGAPDRLHTYKAKATASSLLWSLEDPQSLCIIPGCFRGGSARGTPTKALTAAFCSCAFRCSEM